MAWIEVPDERDWTGRLAELREKLADPASGRVDNILAVHAADPESLQAHVRLYSQAMRGTPGLPKVDREMIALVVSAANQCDY